MYVNLCDESTITTVPSQTFIQVTPALSSIKKKLSTRSINDAVIGHRKKKCIFSYHHLEKFDKQNWLNLNDQTVKSCFLNSQMSKE